jgi:hypothetical protein
MTEIKEYESISVVAEIKEMPVVVYEEVCPFPD